MPAATTNPEEYPLTPAINPASPTSVLLFYNPGLAINEMLAYDNPIRIKGDPKQVQPGYCPIRVGGRGFFEVPTSVIVVSEETGDEQEAPISRIYERVMGMYRSRGVVLVEKDRHKTRKNDDHVAATKAEAIRMGDKFHRDFLKDTANEWIQKVDEVRAAGGVPRGAQGLYAYALKELGIADPADRVDVIQHEREGKTANLDLQAQINELKALLMAKATA